LSDGTVDISKALAVNTEFDLFRQFWTYLVRTDAITDPQAFIHPVPHMSFVRNAADVAFLNKRWAALTAHPLYEGMKCSEDKVNSQNGFPGYGRAGCNESVAATRMPTGTDVDYGALTNILLDSVAGEDGFGMHFSSRVHDLKQDGPRWRARIRTRRRVENARLLRHSRSSVPAATGKLCIRAAASAATHPTGIILRIAELAADMIAVRNSLTSRSRADVGGGSWRNVRVRERLRILSGLNDWPADLGPPRGLVARIGPSDEIVLADGDDGLDGTPRA
jgi:hypothetical protein